MNISKCAKNRSCIDSKFSANEVGCQYPPIIIIDLGAVHILRNTKWGGGLPDLLQYYIGGGLPNLLQYYIGVGLESLLQYYSFVRKMEGYNPFSALY